VRLHFAEIYEPYSYEGARLTDVRAEGITILSDYDIIGDVGAVYTAAIPESLVQVSDGTLNLKILQNKSGVILSGIEVISSSIEVPIPPPDDSELLPPGQPTIILP
jgi:hypothetical protein